MKHVWQIGFFGIEQNPFASYTCDPRQGGCGGQFDFDLHGDGRVPDSLCCIHRERYPVKDRDFAKHLHAKTRKLTEAQILAATSKNAVVALGTISPTMVIVKRK